MIRRKLIKQNNLVRKICFSDKCNRVVLINKDNYHDAMKQLFSGRTKLQLIKDDPFTRLKAVPNYLHNLWKPTRQQGLEATS